MSYILFPFRWLSWWWSFRCDMDFLSPWDIHLIVTRGKDGRDKYVRDYWMAHKPALDGGAGKGEGE